MSRFPTALTFPRSRRSTSVCVCYGVYGDGGREQARVCYALYTAVSGHVAASSYVFRHVGRQGRREGAGEGAE
eukprot:4376170-Prymnesium_polylepis.2